MPGNGPGCTGWRFCRRARKRKRGWGGALRASVIAGAGGGLLLEWLDPAEHPHSHVIPAEKMRGRLVLPLRRMARGGWRNHIHNEERRRMFRRFLVAVWNAVCREG